MTPSFWPFSARRVGSTSNSTPNGLLPLSPRGNSSPSVSQPIAEGLKRPQNRCELEGAPQVPARKKSPAPIRSWQEADAALAAEAGPATAEQLALAATLGISIDPAIPRVVAAAMLRVALQHVLAIEIIRAPVERFEERLDSLRRDSDPPMKPANGEEASAWIEYLHLVRRREALTSRQLCEGAIVKTPNGELAESVDAGSPTQGNEFHSRQTPDRH